MNIDILKANETPRELITEHGSYDQFYARFLRYRGFEFKTYSVFEGNFPASLDEAEGWLVTGSQFS